KKARKTTDKAAKNMDSSFQRITKSLGGAKAMLGSFVAGLGVLAGARGLQRAILKNLDFLDTLDKTSTKLGVSVEWLQKAQFAASQSGISMETFNMALQRYVRRASEAANGTGEAQKAIKELGIELRNVNGTMRSSEEIFESAMHALSKVEDAGRRAALSQKLFDSEGVSLVNLADNFEILSDKAERMGLVVDRDIIKKAVESKDELDTLSKVIRANLSTALVDLAPVLVGAGEHLQYLAQWAAEAWARMVDLLDLKPTTIDQMKTRIEKLKDEIADIDKQLEYHIELLASEKEWNEHKVEDLYALYLGEKRTNMLLSWKAGLLKQLIPLEKEMNAVLERRKTTTAVTPDIDTPERINALKTSWKDYNTERKRSMKLWEREAQNISRSWENLGSTAASTMAQMTTDGEISFRALGEAFIREFTQRAIESLVFNQIFGMIGEFASSLFGPQAGAPLHGWQTPAGTPQPYANSTAEFPALRQTNLSPSLTRGSATSPMIQVINTTGAQATSQAFQDGSARIVIGQIGAKDIVTGGPLDQAIRTKYGMTPKGVRK
ncbi:MAG: hypothetical protein KAS32_28295, partial [Candidatus Peribacteraceae bacterium]|nr:hypothetical protein [Candidatus Peribacteraceae bacterium]